MPSRAHRSFMKDFRAFERRRRRARAEGGDAGRFERIDQTGDQRRLGTDHDKVDRRPPAEIDDARRCRSPPSATHSASSAMPALPGAQ